MADVVSDLVLSFFCCCFYAPGDNGVGAHHHHRYGGGGHYGHHPTGRNGAYHHHGSGGGHKAWGRSRHVPRQTVELRVRMCCEGCERAVRQALQNLRGVERVDVNLRMEKVTVKGYVDRMRVLQEVRRSGKKAEFWSSGGTSRWFASPRGYNYRDDGYNYRRHGRMREPVGSYDDDDDAGCRIM